MIARQVSEFTASHLGNVHSTLGIETRILRLVKSPSGAPSNEALQKFLQLVYHQSDEISAVVGEGVPPLMRAIAGRLEAAAAAAAPVVRSN